MLIRPKRSGEKLMWKRANVTLPTCLMCGRGENLRKLRRSCGFALSYDNGRETFVVALLLPTYRNDIRHGDHFDVKYYSFDPQVLFDREICFHFYSVKAIDSHTTM